MARWIRRGTAAVSALLLALVTLAVPAGTAAAAPTIAFAPKFSANANGALLSIGNGLLTCPPAQQGCAAAQGGASADNNGFTMQHLDADDGVLPAAVSGTTVNSSSSRLELPAGATVLWAGLYWGARLDAGSGGAGPGSLDVAEMALRAPGDTAYRTIEASTASHDQFGPNASSYRAYQRFADVTSIVRAAGNGDYWGGNVAAATGRDRYAGWAMTIAYSAPGMPLRNLTVFDGFDVVDNRNPQTVTVSGFLAPRSGPVDAQLTMVAYEGDLSQTGDYTRLNTTQLASPISPGSNFFNSTNTLAGASVGTRTPAHLNQLGFDVKNLGASGAIGNGDTSATFRFSSNGDVYYPGVVGLAINLFAPDFTASAKSVVNLSGHDPAQPGDTLQYAVHYVNTGQDAAVRAVSQDVLPPGTTYVPGSLRYLATPDAAPQTPSDAPGDDRGEYDAATRTVRMRLGADATATSGGRVAIGSAPSYTFQVTLDDAAGGTTVTNTADLDYVTDTTGTSATYTTNPAVTTVARQADVAVTKVMPDRAAVGTAVTATLTVVNDGPNLATDVVVTDQLPSGWEGVTASTSAGSCSVAAGVVTCALGDLPDGATATVTLTGTTAAASTATSLANVASVSTTSVDPDPVDNVSGATTTLFPSADVAVTKVVDPGPATPGGPVSWTVTVTNNGPSDAQGVVVGDVLDARGPAAITGVTGTGCALVAVGARCIIPTLAAGASTTITVTGRLAPSIGAGVVVSNTATVTATTPDPDTGNNRAQATLTSTEPQADVRVEKTGPTSVQAGAPITWTVTATNWGLANAEGVTVSDVVPAGVTGVTASSSRGTCTVTGNDVSCPVGTLAAAWTGEPAEGAAVTVTITGTVDPGATGALLNTASVTAQTADPVPGNNTATTSTDVAVVYDVAVTKVANRNTLPAEPADVVYTVTVTNNGPSTARDVVVTDQLPPELDLVSTELAGGTCGTSGGVLTCTIPELGPRASATLIVTMHTDVPLSGGEPVLQQVNIAAPQDTNPANDSAQWVLAGEPYTDLSLGKTAPETVTAGQAATYTLVVGNVTPFDPGRTDLDAVDPVVFDTLPAGVSLDGTATVAVENQQPTSPVPGVTCAPTGQDLVCRLTENLDAGATATITVPVAVAADVAAGTTLLNTARVETGDMETNPDPNLTNNTAQATSTVVAAADPAVRNLSVTPVDPAQTGAGSVWTFAFEVTNVGGPSTARDVTVRATIEPDAAILTLPAGCSIARGELVCTVGDLAPDEVRSFSFTIDLTGDTAAGTWQGTAHVASSTPDTDPANNDAVTTFVVTAPVTDLTVTKAPVTGITTPEEGTGGHPAFVAGGAFTYELRVAVPAAQGLGDAEGAVVTDELPVGYRLEQATTTHGSCTITPSPDLTVAGDTVRCDLGTLDAGIGDVTPTAAIVTLNGVLHQDANNLLGGDEWAEQVPNTAVATTTTPLTDGTSRSATAPVDVVEIADLSLAKTPSADSVVAGGTIGFTLTVVNAGPSGVEHAVVFDSLPVGFTLDAAASDCVPPLVTPEVDETTATPQVPDGPGTEIACRVGALAAGESRSLHVVARVGNDLPAGTITNTATVGLLANEGDEADNTATADVAVTVLTNLSVTASASTTTPSAGQDVDLTGVAVNNGPSLTVNANGDTWFPPGFVPYKDSITVPGNVCTWVTEEPPDDPTTMRWRDFQYVLHCGPVTPGQAWMPGDVGLNLVRVYVPVDTPAGEYSGYTTITSDTPETDLTDNRATVTFTVQRVSDTRVTKELVGPDPMVAGAATQWRLIVENLGPSVAEEVVISDAVPEGMAYRAARVEGVGPCPPPEQHTTANGDTEELIRCPVDQLGVGETVDVIVELTVNTDQGGAELCNEAIVGSASLDPNALDNEDRACGRVATSTDVAITITPETQTHLSGDRAELLVTVANNGPQGATDVVATLTMPPGFTDYSGVPVQWPTSWASPPPDGVVGSLTFAVGDLTAGEQVVYRVVGTVTGPPGTVLPVDGVATRAEPDGVASNDADSAQILIIAAQPGPEPTDPDPSPPAPGLPPAPPGLPPAAPELPLAAPDSLPAAVGRPVSGLPVTGAEIAGLVVTALVATGAGLGLLALRRRSRGT